MKAFKTYFLTRTLREKVLLLTIVGLALAVWLNSFAGRARAFVEANRSISAELREQALWLSRRGQISADEARAVGRLDPSKTLDGTQLLAEVNRMAADAGFVSNVQVDDVREDRTTQFVVHSLRFTVRKADYAALIRFYLTLQKRSPYIGLEQMTIQAEPANPAQLTALMKLTSVEVLK